MADTCERKQPGASFIAFGALYLIVKRVRVLPVYLAGAALPLGLTCLLLWRSGVFGKFWFWTVSYGEQYGSIISPATGLLLLLGTLPKVIGPSFLLWALAGMGAYKLARTHRSFFTLSFLGFSCAAVCAGLYFRTHYFVMLLPAVSLLVGASLASPAKTSLRPALAVFFAAAGLSLFLQRDYLFAMDPVQASAATYGENPFPEAQRVARYLRAQSSPQTRIAVLGSEPEILFLRRPPFRDQLHIHVRPDGASEVCGKNAGRNDRGDRAKPAGVRGVRHFASVLAASEHIRRPHLHLGRAIPGDAI